MITTYSQACVDLVKSCEGLRLEAYPDPGTGGAPWTIGFGHTPAHPGQVITVEDADTLLAVDLKFVAVHIVSWFQGVPLTQGMFDALTSLSYNVGNLPIVAPKTTADIRAGRFEQAANEFLNIDHDATGKVLPGLKIRRQREAALFLS